MLFQLFNSLSFHRVLTSSILYAHLEGFSLNLHSLQRHLRVSGNPEPHLTQPRCLQEG